MRRRNLLSLALSLLPATFHPQAPADSAVPINLRRHAVLLGDSGLAAGAPRRILDSLAAGATLIGLGESTHGTREFFQYKRQVIEHLAATGVRVVAFEAPWASTRTIAAYVDGADVAESAIADALQYRVWRTREVLDLLAWMRQENRTLPADRKLVYVGIDPQDYRLAQPGGTIAQIDALLRPADAALADSLAARYRSIAATFDTVMRARRLTREQSTRMVALARDARARLASAERRLATTIGGADAAWLVRSALVVEQNLTQASLGAAERYADAYSWRDSSMASNTQWWLARVAPDARGVIWGHNGHVGVSPLQSGSVTMGIYLRHALGDRYRVLGFEMGSGRFNSNVPSDPQLARPPREGTVDALLAGVAPDPRAHWIADLRALGAPAAAWAERARGLRWLGAGTVDAESYLDIPLRPTFDALVFVGETTASVKVP